MREAASADDDAAVRRNLLFPDGNARRPPVRDHNAVDAASGADLDPAVDEKGKQAPDQRVAHDKTPPARPGQPVSPVAKHEPRRVAETGQIPRGAQQVPDVGSVDHHSAHDRELRQGRLHQSEGGSKFAPVEGLRPKRPAPGHGAGEIRMVVRMVRKGCEIDRPRILQFRDHLGRAREKGLSHLGTRIVAHHVIQVLSCGVRIVLSGKHRVGQPGTAG